MVEALVVVPTVIVKMVDMEEAGEEVVAVIIDKMVINFKIINFKKNLCNIVKKKKKKQERNRKILYFNRTCFLCSVVFIMTKHVLFK